MPVHNSDPSSLLDLKMHLSAFVMNSIQLNPIHWFQFADDAAVISGHERANQIVLLSGVNGLV